MTKATFVLTTNSREEIRYPRPDGSGDDQITVQDDGSSYNVLSTDATPIQIASFPRATVLYWYGDVAEVSAR